jgi:N-acetylglucosamine-6-sulfatase
MHPPIASARRTLSALGLSLAVLLASAFAPSHRTSPDRRPNLVLILTDDQSADSLPHDPPVMPQLQAMVQDPTDHWVAFPNAFLNTPLCCPSRASILTGRYSNHTGVRTNFDGRKLDESSTVATWLHGAGYYTGLIGKYVNGYPYGVGRYVPPGWDRWLAKEQGRQETAYYRYTLIDQGFSVYHGDGPANYSTTVLQSAADSFIASAPTDRPFFLELATSAPHRPFTPAPQDLGAYGSMSLRGPPSLGERDVSDKPAWVQTLPPLGYSGRAAVDAMRRESFESLLSVDRLVASVIGALRDRGALENTVVLYMTDNGFSFGEHRWVGKTCEYEECIRTPFVVRFPSAVSHVDPHLVSNVDLAPTLAELAGVRPPTPVDGQSLVPLLRGDAAVPWRTDVLSEYVGDRKVSPWWEVRTANFAYVELETGERELYDLTGVLGPADPFELDNRAGAPAYRRVESSLAAQLAQLRSG